MLVTTGRGLDLAAELAGVQSAAVPDDVATRFRQLTHPSSGDASFEVLLQLRAELSQIAAELIGRLPAASGVAQSRVLLAALHDPGVWQLGNTVSTRYAGLCDAARVAELTGMNILDALPARDLAQRGLGGPLGALGQWVLLADARAPRVLVDLGPTIRMSWLPSRCDPMAASRILSFDVGPGMRLLDVLARQLTGGEHTFDPGGRLAVQGHKIEPLLEHWLSDPGFECPLPRWSPHGVRPERFLNDAIRMALEADWSVRDLLCTATHLIAESIARAVHRRLPNRVQVDRLLLSGGGRQNGMLLRELTARLPNVALAPVDELGVPSSALDAACIAVLALCHLDQVPGNSTAVTGTEMPRVLGRLTPGSPQNWQRLLQHLSGSTPVPRPLRIAV